MQELIVFSLLFPSLLASLVCYYLSSSFTCMGRSIIACFSVCMVSQKFGLQQVARFFFSPSVSSSYDHQEAESTTTGGAK